MKDLLIFGAGGMARETEWLIRGLNQCGYKYNLIGFCVDDEYYFQNMKVETYPVFSKEWLLEHKDDVSCVFAIGYPKGRRKVMTELKDKGVRFTTLIHPNASVADREKIGSGSIIGEYCTVSVGAVLGEGVFLNGPMVVIGHDSVLGDYTTCFPKAQISGSCQIGESVLIGSMSYIHEKKIIGKEAVIAPGSIVMHNMKPGTHAMGNPARIINI
ncbi:MAG: acetyltransferase [Lachnospiraceae bacterium]|nr:acetyltransferase [Lachnospiraceae bacterium]